MTVLKLEAGGLLVYAPVAPTKECLALLQLESEILALAARLGVVRAPGWLLRNERVEFGHRSADCRRVLVEEL